MDPVRSPLERRVRRLERTSRLLLAGMTIAVLGPLTGAATRSGGGEEGVAEAQVVEGVRARRVQIVDADGRVRIDLRHDSTETGVFIQDGAGDTRLGAAQFAHGGGGYALHGPGGRGAAVLYLRGDGALTLYDADGNVTARFPSQGL